MKKILFAFVMISSILNAVISDGSTYSTYSQYVNPQYAGFYIKEENGELVVTCNGGVVYYNYGRGGVVSYNPLTDRPYFCSLKILPKQEKGWFDSNMPNVSITIRHKYKQ